MIAGCQGPLRTGKWAVSDNGSTSALQAEGKGSIPLRSTMGKSLYTGLAVRRDGHDAPLPQWERRRPITALRWVRFLHGAR